MILISFIRCCSCFSLASYSFGSTASSLMYFSRPFSWPILYFHARSFLKSEIYQNENMALPIDVLDWGELAGPLGFWRSKIFIFQTFLARLQLLHNFGFNAKLGFGFPRDLTTQKIWSYVQYMHSREAQICMQVDLPNSKLWKNPNFFWRERRERVSPCESCSI